MLALLKMLGTGRARQLGPMSRRISDVLCLGVAVLFLAIAFGYYLDPVIALYIFLGAILGLAFLHRTANQYCSTKPSIWGTLQCCLSLACCLYFVLEHPRLSQRLPVLDPLSNVDIVVAITLVLLVLEATRRCIGMTLAVLVCTFLAYGFLGDRLEGPFYHRAMSLPEMLDHLVYTSEGVFGSALEVAAQLVFVFVMFGALFDRFGGGDFFYQLAKSLVGQQTGGSAKVAVVSSALYGSISGSPTADVVTTGSFTIPFMIKTGYPPVRASAIEASASTAGSILPPVMGSAAFLMSDFTGIPYGQIAVAALLPAVFYFFCVYMTVHNYAAKHQIDQPTGEVLPKVAAVLRSQWIYLLPLITIAWAVLTLNRPSFAGALACLAIVPIMLTRSHSFKDMLSRLSRGLIEGVERMIVVGVACAVAGLVIGTLSMTDLTGKISSMMFALTSGNYLLTLITAMVVIIVLGMGMPVPAVYALGAVLAAPALIALGTEVMAAHLFIVYFSAMSAITPPVAVAAFAAASISGGNPMAIGITACRIGIVAFIIPLVFIKNPEILLIGSAMAITLTFLSMLIACLALSGVTEAYLFGRMSIAMRFALIIATTVNLISIGWINFVAVLCTLGLLYLQWQLGRKPTTHCTL